MPIETITIDTEQWAVVPMELLSELAESLACELDARYPACNRAYPSQERKYQSAMEPVFKSRALLLTQQPEQAQQSDDVLAAALDNLMHDNYERSQCGSKNRQADADLIRAALARTQHPAPRPVPISERLPTAADADVTESVWLFNKMVRKWYLYHWRDVETAYISHWLPTGLQRPEVVP